MKVLTTNTLTACASCADVASVGVSFTPDIDQAARSMAAIDRAYDLGARLVVGDPIGYSTRHCELCGDSFAGDRFAVIVRGR